VRSSNVLAVVQRSFEVWCRGTSALKPTVDKSVQYQDFC